MADLTTRCGFPLYPNEHPHDDHIPVLEPTHSLRYLHVVATADQLALHNPEDFFENGIPHFAPSLTHLRLSQLNQDEAVITHLESALGLMLSLLPLRKNSITNLTAALAVLIQTTRKDTTLWWNMLDGSGIRITECLLQADSAPPVEDPYFREWMDKVNGAACRWDTSNVDMTEITQLNSNM
ncbi:hypothetical protein K438DRAFT_1957795 [Mycena galopus ATCC 62051]|nr:hypothetical protein K438DRAFT_1957795 [Mycena galopus ATCC 62051]